MADTPSLQETYFLICMMHDIGTTPENLRKTLLSFEWYGGVLAKNLVEMEGGTREQAEGVMEAVIRHQDLGSVGTITRLGLLVQLATIFGESLLLALGMLKRTIMNF